MTEPAKVIRLELKDIIPPNLKREDVPPRPDDAAEQIGLRHHGYRVFDVGSKETGVERWRYKNGDLVVYIKYPPGYGKDAVYDSSHTRVWFT